MPVKDSKTLQYLIPEWFRCEITTNLFGLVQLALKPIVPVQMMLPFDSVSDKIPEVCPENETPWQLVQQIQEYLNGTQYGFNVHIGVLISGFQKLVFDAVSAIPYGQTSTHLQIAEQIDKTDKVAQVKSVLANNSLPLIVPCHRVINKPDDLGAYVSGTIIKKKLLELERINRL